MLSQIIDDVKNLLIKLREKYKLDIGKGELRAAVDAIARRFWNINIDRYSAAAAALMYLAVKKKDTAILAPIPLLARLLATKEGKQLLDATAASLGADRPTAAAYLVILLSGRSQLIDRYIHDRLKWGSSSGGVEEGAASVVQRMLEYVSVLGLGRGKSAETIDKIISIIDSVAESVRVEGFLGKSVRLPELERLARQTATLISKLVKPAQSTTPFGVVKGVRKMKSLEEVRNLTQSELARIAAAHMLRGTAVGHALDVYNVYRLATKQAMVFEKTLQAEPIIFIDISGSMRSEIEGINITSCMLAGALASGIYQQLGGKVFFFDTRVIPYTPKTPRSLLNICKISGGGTSIAEVFDRIISIEKAKKTRTHGIKNFYIIITDAEDNISNQYLEELKRQRVADRMILLLVNAEEPQWLKRAPFPWVKVLNKQDIMKAMYRMIEAMYKALYKPA